MSLRLLRNYLYTDEPPATPSADSAYRNVHLTVTAVEEAGANSTDASDEFAVDGAVDEPTAVEPIVDEPNAVGSASR